MSDEAEARAQLVQTAHGLRATFLGFTLALPPLVHPDLPLLAVHRDRFGIPPNAPVQIGRNDGSLHSSRSLEEVLREAADLLRNGVLGGDLLAFTAMYGATRIGDDLDAANLRDPDNPLLEFARHLRNACAHGNRWHFVRG